MQAAISDILRCVPMALSAGGDSLYILVKGLAPDLESFILTGRAETDRFQIFTGVDMYAAATFWEQCGLKVECRSHRMEYMRRTVTIDYPRISGNATAMKVSLIPWFALPGKLYPSFAYIYAVWHYHTTGRKSQRHSAEAAGRVFGIDSFHKSTVCRSIKAMESLFDIAQIGEPLSACGQETPPPGELAGLVQKILKGFAPSGALEELLGGKAGRMPGRDGGKGKAPYALESIPRELAAVTKAEAPNAGASRDKRKRPSRPREKGRPIKRHGPSFVEPAKIEQVRKAFIDVSRGIVIDAAIKYRRLLL